MDFLGDILGLAGSAASGGLIGAAMRLVPALFQGVGKIITAKADREHELKMRELDWKIAKDGSEQRIREADAAGFWDATRGQMDALREALAAQRQPSGIKWVDAANAAVRPMVTYYFAALYGLVKLAGFGLALWKGTDIVTALAVLWSPADTQMFFGILGFWFVNRELQRKPQ